MHASESAFVRYLDGVVDLAEVGPEVAELDDLLGVDVLGEVAVLVPLGREGDALASERVAEVGVVVALAGRAEGA